MGKTLSVERTDDGTVKAGVIDTPSGGWGDSGILVDCRYSSLNYKDALALSGNPGVMRLPQLVPGIDVVGHVIDDPTGSFQPGQLVTANGGGLGERRHGGYTDRVRVPREATVAVPEQISAHRAAAIGTAGYTASLCVRWLRHTGVIARCQDTGLPVAVTGATGGVGSVAVMLLKSLGATVTAVTSRPEEFSDYLHRLGAATVIDAAELSQPGKPLQKARFSGAVDCVGSHTLANLLAQTTEEGTVAACGLAQGADLPATVMPFILRGVILRGINSVTQDLRSRNKSWALMAEHLDGELLDELTEDVDLDHVADAGAGLLAGRRHGRTVVATG
ncbi:acryloyl-CoA reductase [Corynebacterium mendelii]|uniref:Acryloyl-CoA reductase n=1 Tax=Corynebacterium mendelii TaxID=2765362 RepID=A0A939E389_9CORY|nr:acryloyl-CoA reductase [Corynebacterium mendelii]MBN9644742.1 acryloyl-CoA reductase [Corynebacterium mendelii]